MRLALLVADYIAWHYVSWVDEAAEDELVDCHHEYSVSESGFLPHYGDADPCFRFGM